MTVKQHIGAEVLDVTTEEAGKYGLDKPPGAVISRLDPKGVCEKSGRECPACSWGSGTRKTTVSMQLTGIRHAALSGGFQAPLSNANGSGGAMSWLQVGFL